MSSAWKLCAGALVSSRTSLRLARCAALALAVGLPAASPARGDGLDLSMPRAVIVGAPRLTLTYSGTVPAGVRPTRVFAQLVDKSTGTVLGNQATPIAITLDGATHTTTVSMEIVAFTAETSSDVELQLVATTVTYEVPRMGGSVKFSTIHLILPVASSLIPVSGPHPDSAPMTAAG